MSDQPTKKVIHEDRQRSRDLLKEIRRISRMGRAGHGFKARHKDRHRGCRNHGGLK